MDYKIRKEDLEIIDQAIKVARKQIDNFEDRDDLTKGIDSSLLNMDDFADSLKSVYDDIQDCAISENNLIGLKLCLDLYLFDVSKWIDLFKMTKNVKFDWTDLTHRRNLLEFHSCEIEKFIEKGIYVL